MLQALRSKVGSWVVKILFVVLILSFGVWGIGDIFRGQVSTTVAEVGDAEISVVELDRTFQNEIRRLQQVIPDVNAERARQLGVLDQTLEQLISRTLFSAEARDAGLVVGDEAVLAEIQRTEIFHDDQGRFDPNRFRQILLNNGMSEQAYVEAVRGDLTRSLLAGAVTTGAVVPKPVAADLFRHEAERRTAETLLIPETATPAPGVPDADTLAKYHQDHAVRFTAPEYRSLTVAQLTPELLAAEIAVAEDELRTAYEDRADEFRTPERRDVTQALLPDQETAAKAAEAVKGGQSITEAAKAAGVEAQSLPDIGRGDLPPELAEPVFSAAQGDVTAPIQSPLGWHVIRVDSIQPATEKPFEAAREALATEIRQDRAAEMVLEVGNRLEDAIAGGISLEEAAQRVGAKLVKLPAADAGGLSPEGRELDDQVRGLPSVLETAFRLGRGDQSSLVEAPDGSAFVVRVDEVTPAKLRPLEEVKDQVVAAWQAEQRAQATARKAEEVASEVRTGKPLAEIAAGIPGARAERIEGITRTASAPGGASPLLVSKLFELKAGEVAVVPGEGGQVVVRLEKVDVPDPAASEAEVARLGETMERGMVNDLLTQFAAALRQEHPVEINRATLDSMYSQN